MKRNTPRDRAPCARGLLLVIAVAASAFALILDFDQKSAAMTPVFSRPNVLVDSDVGPVGVMYPGGPVIASDAAGILHAAWSDGRAGPKIYYAKSLDGGMTWTGEKRIDGLPFESYAPSIAIDPSGGPYAGNIYVAWQYRKASQADVYVIRSVDAGNTWTDRRRIEPGSLYNSSEYPKVAVNEDGQVFVAFQDDRATDDNVYVARSDDGGVNWYPEVRVSRGDGYDSRPSLAFLDGTIFVGWTELKGWDIRLWIAASDDAGRTWQPRLIASFDNSQLDIMYMSVSASEDGLLHASWHERDYTIDYAAIVYSRSSDAGVTWSAPVKVSDAPPGVDFATIGLSIVSSSDMVYVVWADNRNGDYDIFASWSEDRGVTWGDGIPTYADIRVDDTDENTNTSDDATQQTSPTAALGPYGVYVIWGDRRDSVAYHAYFASFETTPLLITEIRDGPNGMEQVELFNRVGVGLDLTGWGLFADGSWFDLSSLGSISPFSYLTIGDPPTSNLVRDITLGDEGGSIRIVDAFGKLVDAVGYGQLGPAPDPLNSESVARDRAIEGYYVSWTREPVPTFGAQNREKQPIRNPTLVLNEVFFNAVNPNDRFIELYFRGQGSMSVGNYKLVGDSPYDLPATVLNETDPYLAVRPSDAPSLFSLMSAFGDNLYLYDPNLTFMDMVGWSSPHVQGTSMLRVPDGFGTSDGYNDTTSIAAGWRFDQTPSLPLVLIGPRQTKAGNLGDRVFYTLRVTNKEPSGTYVNIEALPGTQGWPVTLFQADGVTPLADSPGDPDSVPDVGLVPAGASIEMQASVDIPSVPPTQDVERSSLIATVPSDSFVRAAVTITTCVYPYEAPSAFATPSTIWRRGSPPAYQPQETLVTLNVAGRGLPYSKPRPIDVVLIIDASGSMAGNDPTHMRLEAAKHFVDLLSVPDRAAVIEFDTKAVLINGTHLSSDYAQIKSNIDSITDGGSTDLRLPIKAATDEILAYGLSSHAWIEILLTDGKDTVGNTHSQILAEANRAASNDIVIFTIGLIGQDQVDEDLLQQIAAVTGGMYLRARSPSDLEAIYEMIGNLMWHIAGYDDDVRDCIPMVNVTLPSHIEYVQGSASPPPSYFRQTVGRTHLQWNISKLDINQTWTATFRVASSPAGSGISVLSIPESRVTYFSHEDKRTVMPFPDVLIDVLEPPKKPDLFLLPSDLVPSPPPYYVNATVFINATIHNKGTEASGETAVRFHDGVPPSFRIPPDQRLSSVPTGGAQTVSIQWTAKPVGAHSICAVADPDNMIIEEDETNNIACIPILVESIPIIGPDYVPVLPIPGSMTKVGMSIALSLSIQVSNSGNGTSSSDSILAFYNESGTPFATRLVPPLDSSAISSRFNATWMSPNAPGTYLVLAEVDYLDDLSEWNETDNVHIWTIEVVAGPVTSLVVGQPNYTSVPAYVTSSTPLDFDVFDQSGMGIRHTSYSIDGGAWNNYTATGTFHLAGEGEHTVHWFSEDYAGNVESTAAAVLRVDNTPPTTSMIVGDPKQSVGGNFVTSSTPIALHAVDDGITPVGVQVTRYRIDGGIWKDYYSPFTLAGEGTHTVECYSSDFLTNRETGCSTQFIVDNTPPTTTLSIGEPKYLVGGAFVTSLTPLILQADDGGVRPVGLGSIAYRIWDGGWQLPQTYHSSFLIAGKDGVKYVEYGSADLLGNHEITRNVTIILDNAPPVMLFRPEAAKVPIDTQFFLAADDGDGCGLATLEYSIDEAPYASYSGPFVLSVGVHRITYRSSDYLGNSIGMTRVVEISQPSVPPDARPVLNYKPMIAAVFAITLAVVGLWSAERRPWKGQRNLGSVIIVYALTCLPFVLGEAATGIVSLFTGELSIPPAYGVGTVVDLAVFSIGLGIAFYRVVYIHLQKLRRKTPDQS